jgi:hypothetical protein
MTVSSPRSLRNSLYLEQIVEAHSLGFLAGTRLVLSSSYTYPEPETSTALPQALLRPVAQASASKGKLLERMSIVHCDSVRGLLTRVSSYGDERKTIST